MSGIRCVLLEPLPLARHSISIYSDVGPCPATPGGSGKHRADVSLGEYPDDDGAECVGPSLDDPGLPWPSHCACGHDFAADGEHTTRHLSSDPLYRRSDTGEPLTLGDAPTGAMWYADWMLTEGSPLHRGPDGRCLVVRTPGGTWMIDGRASNCTMPEDDEHKCWVRHGTPPHVTVDKNGRTCGAGGGSIVTGSYHGFLRNGELVVA